jgi:hypothetical protein
VCTSRWFDLDISTNIKENIHALPSDMFICTCTSRIKILYFSILFSCTSRRLGVYSLILKLCTSRWWLCVLPAEQLFYLYFPTGCYVPSKPKMRTSRCYFRVLPDGQFLFTMGRVFLETVCLNFRTY